MRVVTLDCRAETAPEMERVLTGDVLDLYRSFGCDHFHVAREQGRPTEFILVSVWHSAADLQRMRLTPEYPAWWPTCGP